MAQEVKYSKYPKGYPYAVGLIQFKATAAKAIGINLKTIYHANLLTQFSYVKKYLDHEIEKRKPKTLDQGTIYTLVFSPAYASGSSDRILYSEGSGDYESNKSLDKYPQDGHITKKELGQRLDSAINEGKGYATTLLGR